VKNVSDRVAVMYLGRICEVGPVESVYQSPSHHYTQALLAAVPTTDTARRHHDLHAAVSEPPSLLNPPSGCRFRTRCPAAQADCTVDEPQLREVAPGHLVACHHPATAGTRPAEAAVPV